MDVRPTLSLILPCLDEAERLPRCLEAIAAWDAHRADRMAADRMAADRMGADGVGAGGGGELEVIVVDDGSRDGTAHIAEASAPTGLLVRVVPSDPAAVGTNRGKGHALRAGVAAAQGAVIAFLDADLAVEPSQLGGLLAAIEAGADVAVGCRSIPGAEIARPQGAPRRWMGRAYLVLARRWLGLSVRDITCGFKAFRAPVGRELFAASRAARWGIDAETLHLAERRGYTVAEVPVRWVDGGRSRVRLLRDIGGSFGSLLAVRWRHRATQATSEGVAASRVACEATIPDANPTASASAQSAGGR